MQLRQQRRFCDRGASAIAASSVMAASFAMAASSPIAMPSAITTFSVMVTSSASRDYAKHSIMNASVSFSFWHKCAVVNDGFYGTQKALYKRPVQKRGTCQSTQKSPSARRKIVHNRKFVPELPKSGYVFGKAGTKKEARKQSEVGRCTESKGPGARARPANERLQEAEDVPRIGGGAESKSSKTSSARKSESSLWRRKLNDHTDRAVTQAECRTG